MLHNVTKDHFFAEMSQEHISQRRPIKFSRTQNIYKITYIHPIRVKILKARAPIEVIFFLFF